MVEDVRVQVHTYDAEMGRTGGGVFNTTAKSGSNAVPRHPGISRRVRRRWSGRTSSTRFATVADQGCSNLEERRRRLRRPDPARARRSSGSRARPIATTSRRTATCTCRPPRCATATSRGLFNAARASPIVIYDPLTTDANGNRQPFPGNIIPANRINAVGRNMVNALPMPHGRARTSTTATSTTSAQDILENKAQQGSLKIDHHFNDSISLSGVYLFQNSSEPDANYFPDAPYAAPSYQLDRAINVFVLNNTYILNPTTVATFRFGMNTFDDDNSLPFDFDSHTLGWNPAFADAIPVQKFPSLTLTGAADTRARASAESTTAITTPGASTARSPSSPDRTASRWARTIASSASTRSTTGSRPAATPSAARSPAATPQPERAQPQRDCRPAARVSASRERSRCNSRFDNFVKYYGMFVQDDWRVTDKLTFNYGVRLEHETGLREVNDQLVVGLRSRGGEPAQRHHSRRSGCRDAGAPGDGRPRVRGTERRQRLRRQSADDQALAARRHGLQHESTRP